MRRLYLLHSEKRYLRGQEIRSLPSRFLREIPEQFLVEVRMGFEDTAVNGAKAATSVAVAGKTRSDWPFQLGEQVRHPTFGEGVVLNLEGSGKHARAQINFAGVGYKWLILSYAKLTPC
jgi:DNA helicase-2/ATP-dependent DNA helicase PcrA